jgi:hypothetical protein
LGHIADHTRVDCHPIEGVHRGTTKSRARESFKRTPFESKIII